jgi:hypothetical protein
VSSWLVFPKWTTSLLWPCSSAYSGVADTEILIRQIALPLYSAEDVIEKEAGPKHPDCEFVQVFSIIVQGWRQETRDSGMHKERKRPDMEDPKAMIGC